MAASEFSIEIDKKGVSEIRSYSKPPAAVTQVVTATALLLGQPEQHVQDWKFLKALFSIPGNKSLQHQMNNIDISQISESAALKARDIIELIDADMVRCTSALAYDMYRWNDNVISAVLESKEKQET